MTPIATARGWPELSFLSRVAFKVEQIRDDLGSVGAVLADQVGDDIDTDRDIQDGHSSQGPLGGLVDEGV